MAGSANGRSPFPGLFVAYPPARRNWRAMAPVGLPEPPDLSEQPNAADESSSDEDAAKWGDLFGPPIDIPDDVDDRVRDYAATGVAPPGLLRTTRAVTGGGEAAAALPAGRSMPPPIVDAAGLTTSEAARQVIKAFELNPHTGQPNLEPSGDGEGNPTFGYGHKLDANSERAFRAQLAGIKPADRPAFAEKVFSDDLKTAEDRVRDRLGPEAMATLNQHQFDALVADAFNAGGGGALGPAMLQNIWDGDLAAAGQQFNGWWAKEAGGVVPEPLSGLIKRNLEESAIFNRGDYGFRPDPDAVAKIKAAEVARRRPRP